MTSDSSAPTGPQHRHENEVGLLRGLIPGRVRVPLPGCEGFCRTAAGPTHQPSHSMDNRVPRLAVPVCPRYVLGRAKR